MSVGDTPEFQKISNASYGLIFIMCVACLGAGFIGASVMDDDEQRAVEITALKDRITELEYTLINKIESALEAQDRFNKIQKDYFLDEVHGLRNDVNREVQIIERELENLRRKHEIINVNQP